MTWVAPAVLIAAISPHSMVYGSPALLCSKYWKISSIFSPRTQEIKWEFERGFGVSYARKLQKERRDPRSAVEAWKAGGK
jgi:hypothetical protein